MRGGVVAYDVPAPLALHGRGDPLADLQRALLQGAAMQMLAAPSGGVGHDKPDSVGGDHSRIADLAAGLRVEGRAVEHDIARLRGFQALSLHRGSSATGVLR